MPTFEQIITAEFDLAAMKELFFKVYTHPYVEELLAHLQNFIDSIGNVAWALMIGFVALIFSNFGKKLLAIPLVAIISGIGYLAGAIYLAPLLESLVEKYEFLQSFMSIDPVVVGIIAAAVGAVLFLPIYFIGYGVAICYLTYLFVYPVCAVAFGSTTAMIIGLGAGVAVAVVAYIFRKWVEMGVTGIAGAYFVMIAINQIVLLPLVVNYIIWAVLAVQGTAVQIKTRRRY